MFSDNDNLKRNVAVQHSNNENEFDYDWAMKRLKKMMANSFFGDVKPESVSFFRFFNKKVADSIAEDECPLKNNPPLWYRK